MSKINKAIEKLLLDEPHLTRSEAIRYITDKADKKRNKKISKEKRKQTIIKLSKGQEFVKSISTVSGGRVSPK